MSKTTKMQHVFKTPKHTLRKQNNQEQMGNKEIKEENVNGFEEDVCSKLKKKKKKIRKLHHLPRVEYEEYVCLI